ncbi:N-acetylmuramoyl-L-alanine amidase [Pseudogracilibacillus auburnensis]|uniref:N-acetylmuramoyl-L-alanine amidase n=1 Tax=Pseudogracilibacillus auburnensis TaxID=1494959 RepID=UPI001A96666C|nr:N-acetylmuramoyl-L-alanine amidase [Pseudogracilibacillus auburnensis]MBO1006015.1 SH3 domain-containing protein [Pseudogracilibacillus auburnensis]
MRLNLTAALLSIAIIFFYCVSDNAYANGSFKVGTSSLNVRTEPFIQADVIGSLPKGTQVNVLELKHDWAKIQYQGKVGWIASHYLYSSTSVSASASIKSNKSITVAAQGVRLRSGPGTDYSIIGYSTYGETFQLIESKGDWKHVRLNNDNSAWIAGWLVTADGQVHAAPKKSSNKVGNLSGKTIILDAGHGGYDPGAIGVGGVLEKDLNNRTSQIVKKKLQGAGAKVIMTRSGDRYVDLQNRINMSQAYPSAIFISIHHNAHKNSAAHGINTFYVLLPSN